MSLRKKLLCRIFLWIYARKKTESTLICRIVVLCLIQEVAPLQSYSMYAKRSIVSYIEFWVKVKIRIYCFSLSSSHLLFEEKGEEKHN